MSLGNADRLHLTVSESFKAVLTEEQQRNIGTHILFHQRGACYDTVYRHGTLTIVDKNMKSTSKEKKIKEEPGKKETI